MRKFRRTSNKKPGGLTYVGSHLTDDSLLLWLDGELTASEAAVVQEHLQACWACRGHSKAMEQSITDLVAYQNSLSRAYLPPPAHARSLFLARLQASADAAGRPPRLKEWLVRTGKVLQPGGLSQFGWAMLILVVFLTPLGFYFFTSPSIVSADEVMTRSAANEAIALEGTASPVVVQKIRVQLGGESTTHTVYSDIVHHRSTSRPVGTATVSRGLRAAYLRSSLDWNELLTSQSYAHLNRVKRVARYTVRRHGQDRLVLGAVYIGGPISAADLTVRLPDYHPVQENIELSDNSQIELAELSFAVIPLSAVPAGIFSAPATTTVHTPLLAANPHPAFLSMEELSSTEVKADAVLHAAGADLGEQIDTRLVPGRGVVIEGIVADDERRRQLLAALKPVRHTTVHLMTVAEAAQRSASPRVAENGATAGMQAIAGGPPLLEKELTHHFPDKDQRQSYVHQTLSLVQSASGRAWALNRLATRYSAQSTAALDSDGRRQLAILLADHAAALREDLSALQNQMAAVLSTSSNTPSANTSILSLADAAPGPSERGEDWRSRSHRMLSSVEAVHEAIVALLTTSQTGDQGDTESIEINLRTSLTQAQSELQTLEQSFTRATLK